MLILMHMDSDMPYVSLCCGCMRPVRDAGTSQRFRIQTH